MRGNSSLWLAALVGGGLLVAGLVGLVAIAALGSRSAEQALRKRAETTATTKEPPVEEKPTPALEEKSTSKTAPTSPAPKPAGPATAADLWRKAAAKEYARDLWAAFETNAVAAENKYKDRSVGLVGSVVKIDTDPMGRGVVVLAAGDDELAALAGQVVTCTMDPIDKHRLADLSAGQWVAVVGDCKGKTLTVVRLEKCRYLHATATAQEMDRYLRGPR